MGHGHQLDQALLAGRRHGACMSPSSTAWNGCVVLPFRMLRRQRLHAIEDERQLDVHRLFDPQRAVVVERRDALIRRHEVRPPCVVTRETNVVMDCLVAPSFHDGSGSACACAAAPLRPNAVVASVMLSMVRRLRVPGVSVMTIPDSVQLIVRKAPPDICPAALCVQSVSGRHRNRDAFLGQLLPDPVRTSRSSKGSSGRCSRSFAACGADT